MQRYGMRQLLLASFAEHGYNETVPPFELTDSVADGEGGVGGFRWNDNDDTGGYGGRRPTFQASQHDSQLVNQAMDQAIALIDLSVVDPYRVWNASKTLFLAANDEDE